MSSLGRIGAGDRSEHRLAIAALIAGFTLLRLLLAATVPRPDRRQARLYPFSRRPANSANTCR